MAFSDRRRRWPRWIIYSFLAPLAAGGLAIIIYIHSGHPEAYLRRQLIDGLSRTLGRAVTLERVGIEYLPPGITIEGLRDEGPVLGARRIEASLSLRALLRGRFVVKDVDLYDPVLRWDVDTGHLVAERAPAGQQDGSVASRVSLMRLRIHRGEVRIGSQRRAISAEIEGLSLLVDNGSHEPGAIGIKGPWSGSFNFTRGRFVLDDLTVDGLAGSVSFECDAALVHARRLRLRADGVDVRGAGLVQPESPMKGRLDLKLLLSPDAAAITRPLRQFSARQVSADMRIALSAEGVKVSGNFTADGPTIDVDRQAGSDGPETPWTARSGAGTFTIDGRRIDIGGTLDSFSGGTIVGRYVGVIPESGGAREHRVTLDANGLRLDDVLRHYDLPGDDGVAPAAAISGKATVSWSGSDIDHMLGHADLAFARRPGDLPVSGAASIAWEGRRVSIESSTIETSGSRAEVTGMVDATTEEMGLKLSGRLTSEDSDPLRRFIEGRFGRIPGEPNGRIRSAFEVDGTTAKPEVRASFEASDLDVSLPALQAGIGQTGSARVPVRLNSAAGSLSYRRDLVELQLEQARAEDLDLSASLRIDPRNGEILSLGLNAPKAPAETLVRMAGLDPDRLRAVGTVVVTAQLTGVGGGVGAGGGAGRPDPLCGETELTASQVIVNDIRLNDLKAHARLDPGRLHLTELALGLFGGTVRGEGEMDRGGGGGTIDIKATGIDLGAIDADYAGPSMEGLLAATARITLGGPGSIEATLSGDGTKIAGIVLGRLTGSLGGPLDRIDLDLQDSTGQLTASGAFSSGTGYSALEVDATVTARGFSLEEIRPLLPRGALGGLQGEADGVVSVRGPLLKPAELEIHALLDRIGLTAGDYTLHNDGTIRLTEENGFLTLAPMRLVGEKTDLTLGGSMVLGGSHEVTARVQGSYDLGLIEILFPEIRASGPGKADLGVIQRGDTLTYTGTISLDGGSIAHPALPLPLTNLKGRGEFTEQGQLRVDEIGFDMGGGHAIGNGWVRFEGASMPQLHLAMTGRGIRAELLPEFRAFFDSDVTLDKDNESYRFAGKVTIQRAIYSRPFGVEASELLLRSREYTPAHERRPGAPEVFLDLDIAADGDVWVRNQDALIEASAHLSLEGTLERPELSGRISALEGGTYRFRDVTYRIVGGSLDFADVTRIDPLIDIEASTRVQQYEITLRITGRFSKPVYELTADPPLPQRDVVWLLLTGHTLAESPGNEATRGFAEGQVASYLAAPVTGAVSAPLEKILGVSSVQIDPFFLNGTADPSARLTVTKRMASDLLFTYSSSLGQSGQEIYQVEYNPGRLWDLIATRDLDGSIGADMRFRRRWAGLRPPAPAPPPRQGGPVAAINGGAEAPARLHVGRISIVGDHLVDSEKALARRLPFDENDLFHRGDLLEGRETLRQHYVKHGYPAAQVDVIEEEPDPAAPSQVNVRYVINAGPRHELEIDGNARERPIRRAVKSAWQEPILLEDLVEEARKAALGLLQRQGFFTAKVDAAIDSPAQDRRVVKVVLQPGPKVHVRSIAVSGNAGMPVDRIRHQMLTHENGWINLFGGGLLKAPVLDDDLDAIRGLYLANGYLSVKVARPEIRLSKDRREADVTIHIEEGPQSRIEAVSIEGWAEGVPSEDLVEAVGLSPTQIVSTQIVERAADRLREELDKNGYSSARVGYRLEGAPERTRVIFSISPFERVRVRSVSIEGNTRTHTGIVRREVDVKEGEYLSRSAVLATQRNLYQLGVFRSVQVDSEPVEGRSGLVNVRVRLQEGPPLLTAWGLGYDTEDRARASFEVANNNLFGTRRAAALFLRASAVDRRVQVTLRDPNLFAEKIETLVSGFVERQELTSFDLRRTGAAAQLSRKLGEHTTLFGRYRLEDVDLFNLKISPEETGQQTARLGSVAASLAYDTRDDIINPTRGGFSTVDARLYSRWLRSEASFTRIFASAAGFKNIGHGVIWASSVRAGLILEPHDPAPSHVPISERFFAGGDTTLRGFEFNTVGPQDPNTMKPIGGDGLFLINQELRFPIFKALKGVIFYDAGNVYPRFRDYDPTDLRHVGGLGLRFDTPVGPFRIEYGRKLDREPGESLGEFFFSIGQAF